MQNRNPVTLFFIISFSACQNNINRLEDGFRNPLEDTKPWVYWYWIDENISKEGITKDLEAMARVGIGQALIGHISPGYVRGDTKILSKEWWDMVAFAVKEGQRLGVDIGFFNGPGWSQSGGPWIKLEQSMRHVVSRDVRVKGPGTFNEKLPIPGKDFRQIAVQAFPIIPASEKTACNADISKIRSVPETPDLHNLIDGDTTTIYRFPENLFGGKIILEFQCKKKLLIQALRFIYMPVSFYAEVDFQAADRIGRFQTIRQFTLDRRNINFQIGPKRFEPVSFSVPATDSDKYRLVLNNIKASSGAGLKELELLAGAVVDNHIDKQLGKMFSDPLPLSDAYLWPDQPEPGNGFVINPEEIVDLTSRVDSSGILHWDIPAGDWLILNSGMMPTGAVNVPAPPEATGYECDKFSKEAIETHFNAFIGKFLEEVPKEDRNALKTIVIDSHEVGSQNWTDGFENIFFARFGYDPIPWMPVFAGRIVKNADLSNRFLWDVRRLTADLIAENYVGGLREISNRHGLNLWLENYGHWGFPAEFLQYGGQADMISGEFWFENPLWDLGPLECRAASSAAHLYGKKQVFAEAFTAGFNFRQHPGSMKSRGDRMFCEGINHFVLHVYIHQPWEDRVPGVTAWFGMSFQRNNTWFEQSKPWIDYLRRCHYMLQQGEPVTDICYFIGEDAPKMTGALKPALPSGYDYDFINAEALINSTVKDGSLTLGYGKRYRLLILPELITMRPELLDKLERLIAEGASIFGPPPICSPSLKGYPGADENVSALALKIWGNLDGGRSVNRDYGKGHIYNKMELGKVFNSLPLEPDVICTDSGIVWTHRKMKDTDIYFISNQLDREFSARLSFRVKDKAPEFWYPDTGEIIGCSVFQNVNNRTIVPVTLDPSGSEFIIFRKTAHQTSAIEDQKDEEAKMEYITITDPWILYFPEGWDALDSIQVHRLVSWTDFPQAGIKYFSGTAVYQNTFELQEEVLNEGERIFLDLGEVKVMAEVTVNGNNKGVLWKKPYKADITDVVKPGRNRLTVRVTNTWWNRLVGDERYPGGFPGSDFHGSRTFVTVKGWNANDQLLTSGLIGPVEVVIVSENNSHD
ncbi:MAG TPA: glycosyl hydrolase [Cyclobacteriaceae bacterium]|nr:glycosyl hydrolase [Cyclobacteriaceae bacterium]